MANGRCFSVSSRLFFSCSPFLFLFCFLTFHWRRGGGGGTPLILENSGVVVPATEGHGYHGVVEASILNLLIKGHRLGKGWGKNLTLLSHLFYPFYALSLLQLLHPLLIYYFSFCFCSCSCSFSSSPCSSSSSSAFCFLLLLLVLLRLLLFRRLLLLIVSLIRRSSGRLSQ